MVKKYQVVLREEERQELKALVSRGRAAAYRQTQARILLLSDENQAEGPMQDEEIAPPVPEGGDGHGEAGAPALRGRGSGAGPRAQGATEPAAAAAGRSRRGLPRIQYGAGSGGSGRHRTAGGPGQLDPQALGGSVGGMRDSGEQHYARVRAVQRRLTGESAQGCMLMIRGAVRIKTELTLVLIARWRAWSGRLATASLVTLQAERSRSIDCSILASPSGDTSTLQARRQ